VSANQADAKKVAGVHTMCRVLQVSTSGYYAWCNRGRSTREQANALLTERIRQIHRECDSTYGMPRIRKQLSREGVRVSRRRVARLMRTAGIRGVTRRRFTVTTHASQRQAAPDLVRRRFDAAQPNKLWVADITYVPTWSGFLYLATVLDVFSRKIVGWSMSEQMPANLVLSALEMALQARHPAAVIHHSDQGSQYSSYLFTQRCRQAGVRTSMGAVGDAYDNAMAESFFATLECELIARRSWKTPGEARAALFQWIEGWYNPRRLHSALDYLSPCEYERRFLQCSAPEQSDA